MVTTSTPVASVVTTMKISSLIRSPVVFLSRSFTASHPRRSPSETVAPRTIGPTSSPPRSGTSAAVVPRPGREQAWPAGRTPPASRRSRRSRRAGDAASYDAAGALGALAERRVDAVVEVGLAADRVGLVPRRVGQVQAGRAAVVAEPRRVVGSVAARLVGQRLEDDVQGEAAERLGLELAGVDDAAEQAGELGRVARQHPQLGPADLAEPDQVVAVVVEEGARGAGELGDVVEERVQLGRAVLEGAGGGHRVVQDGRRSAGSTSA